MVIDAFAFLDDQQIARRWAGRDFRPLCGHRLPGLNKPDRADIFARNVNHFGIGQFDMRFAGLRRERLGPDLGAIDQLDGNRESDIASGCVPRGETG